MDGGEIDLGEVWLVGGWLGGGIWRRGFRRLRWRRCGAFRAGADQAGGVSLRRRFDGIGGGEHDALAIEDGVDAGTKAWPLGPIEIEVTAEVEQGDLTDLLAGAFGGDEAEGKV